MIGKVKISRGALAASSTMKRYWQNSAGKQHHIINPSTHSPSDSGIVASFVLAKTALIADSLATALIISPGLNLRLQELYSVESMLVRERHTVWPTYQPNFSDFTCERGTPVVSMSV